VDKLAPFVSKEEMHVLKTLPFIQEETEFEIFHAVCQNNQSEMVHGEWGLLLGQIY
jgi:hypothetical protein